MNADIKIIGLDFVNAYPAGTGDTFVNSKKPDSARIIENPAQLGNSLAALRKMDIKTVYPGHGKAFLMEDFLRAR